MNFKRIAALLLVVCLTLPLTAGASEEPVKKPIKWVDFTVPATVMKKALDLDKKTEQDGSRLNWIEVLAYLGAKCGGDFKKHREQTLNKLPEKLAAGETMASLTCGMKYYPYYLEAYTAALGGLAGAYSVQNEKDGVWEDKYGLRAFHPIARGYDYQHYDDFGTGRDYGYKRRHLGHDIIALTGTPVVAVESGTVEELGWNQYGGWRIGIRSLDRKRYYYYAHLRKNRPYAEGLAKGADVLAGDVIGYVGRTGYSSKENTNNISQSHLHFGIQLIFDESQKDGNNQIWIDPYEIVKLLANHRGEVVRNPETKEYRRAVPYREVLSQEDGDGALVPLPVIMYHSILKDPRKRGMYTITPDELEADLKWLKENGYRTVTVEQAAAFAEQGVPLPEKPVLLTFDDGHYNNAYYADPLLKKYGDTALLFIVGEFIEKSEKEGGQNPNYSYSNRETLKGLAKEGVWEIESHSYALHRNKKGREGVKRAKGESEEDHRAVLREDFQKIEALVREVTGRGVRAFAYPFGALCGEADDALREAGVKMTFTCVAGVSRIKAGEPESLYRLKRYLRPSGKPVSRLLGG